MEDIITLTEPRISERRVVIDEKTVIVFNGKIYEMKEINGEIRFIEKEDERV